MRTKAEIEKEIEEVNDKMFLEQMADFMDWRFYCQLTYRLHCLKEELKQLENEVK